MEGLNNVVDARGNNVIDGDLLLKIVDGGNRANALAYSVAIGNKVFYTDNCNEVRIHSNIKSNQIIKISDICESEEDIRIKIIGAVANCRNPFVSKSTIEIAKSLCKGD